LKDEEVAEEDVAAVFECDGFVAYAGLLGLEHGVVTARRADGWWSGGAGGTLGSEACAGGTDAARACAVAEAFAEDDAGTGDRNVVDALAPDEGVMPVILAVVLVGVPCG